MFWTSKLWSDILTNPGGFYSRHFVCICFSQKIQFLYCFLSRLSFLKILKFWCQVPWQRHGCRSLINMFFCKYYGLLVSLSKIASQKLTSMVQDIRGMETTCTPPINMVRTIMKDACNFPSQMFVNI